MAIFFSFIEIDAIVADIARNSEYIRKTLTVIVSSDKYRMLLHGALFWFYFYGELMLFADFFQLNWQLS